MKYFRKVKESRGLPDRIYLAEGILSIFFNEDENVVFMESCDEYFFETFSKKEAVEMLQEAIDWIKEN